MRTSAAILSIALCPGVLGAVSAAEHEDAIAAGRALAAPCVACHGEDGNALIPAYPNIAGQNARYLLRQMQLMRDGKRDAPLMAGQLDAMTDDDLLDLALFYESQQAKFGQAAPSSAAQGEAIYRGGILHKQVAACTACHAPDGSGNPPAGFPSLSGQQVDYVIAQLTAFREGRRTTDAEDYGGMMRQTVQNMTDGEIAAVANYLSGLH